MAKKNIGILGIFLYLYGYNRNISILIHENKYNYSLCEYINSSKKIKIICSKHGVFEQTPDAHLNQKNGCPFCKESKGERELVNILNRKNIKYIRQKWFDGCRNINTKRVLKFDFYLSDFNICIEFDGLQHYSPKKHFGGELGFKKQQIRDNIKNDYCKINNINLVRIRFDENIEEKLSQELNKLNIYIK